MNLPDDYFLDTDDEMLEYLEKQAEITTDDAFQSIQRNKDKAFSVFNLLLTGCGGSFLLWSANSLLQMLDTALLIASGMWGFLSVYLTAFVIALKQRPLRGNLPQNYYISLYKNFNEYAEWRAEKGVETLNRTALLRRFELTNINATINDLIKLNQKQVKHFNRVLYLSSATPIISVICSLVLV